MPKTNKVEIEDTSLNIHISVLSLLSVKEELKLSTFKDLKFHLVKNNAYSSLMKELVDISEDHWFLFNQHKLISKHQKQKIMGITIDYILIGLAGVLVITLFYFLCMLIRIELLESGIKAI